MAPLENVIIDLVRSNNPEFFALSKDEHELFHDLYPSGRYVVKPNVAECRAISFCICRFVKSRHPNSTVGFLSMYDAGYRAVCNPYVVAYFNMGEGGEGGDRRHVAIDTTRFAVAAPSFNALVKKLQDHYEAQNVTWFDDVDVGSFYNTTIRYKANEEELSMQPKDLIKLAFDTFEMHHPDEYRDVKGSFSHAKAAFVPVMSSILERFDARLIGFPRNALDRTHFEDNQFVGTFWAKPADQHREQIEELCKKHGCCCIAFNDGMVLVWLPMYWDLRFRRNACSMEADQEFQKSLLGSKKDMWGIVGPNYTLENFDVLKDAVRTDMINM